MRKRVVTNSRKFKDPYTPESGKDIIVSSVRACFTELSFDHLAKHAKQFGDFALEFKIGTLRGLGALPVVYIPNWKSTEDINLHRLGLILLANIVEIQLLLKVLQKTQHKKDEEPFKWQNSSGGCGSQKFNTDEIKIIKRYLSTLKGICGDFEFSTLDATLDSLSGLFYPTEDLAYNSELDYYRQREWRIVSGVHWNNKPLANPLNQKQKNQLLEINEKFFNSQAKHALKEDNCRLDNCLYFKEFQNRHILYLVERILVPEDKFDRAKKIISSHGFNISIQPMPQ